MAQNDWLIVFLIYADYRDKEFKNNEKTIRELENILMDLKDCKINHGVKIVGLLNSIKYETEGSERSLKDVTIIFEVQSKWCKWKNQIEIIKTIDNGGNSTSKPHSEQLSSVFEFLKKEYKPGKIFLNTWDHGSVFGIFKETTPVDKIIEHTTFRKSNFEVTKLFLQISKRLNLADFRFNKFGQNDKKLYNFKGHYFHLTENSETSISTGLFDHLKALELFNQNIKFIENTEREQYIYFELPEIFEESDIIQEFNLTADQLREFELLFYKKQEKKIVGSILIEKAYEILTNIELANAINKGFGKVDLMLMMNCWMLNFDTLYTFKDTVNYLVAPVDDIDEPGYNYLEIINRINKKSIAEEIAINCINTLPLNKQEYRQDKKYTTEFYAQWLVTGYFLNSEKINLIANKIDDFARQMNDYAKAKDIHILKTQLFDMASFCYRFNSNFDYNLRDVTHFLRNITFHIGTNLSQDLEAVLNDTIVVIEEAYNGLILHTTPSKQIPQLFCLSDRIRTNCKTIGHVASGISIFLPCDFKPFDLTKPPYSINAELISESLFIQEKKEWNCFLNTYFT